MDKNFIDVDNLVKQRLSGGEEQERSGAWQNMRELLDKEMPQQQPVGGFFWRRTLGVVAAVLFVGTIGVGGYKMVSSNDSKNTDGAISSAPGINVPSAKVTAQGQLSASGTNDNNKQRDNGEITSGQPVAATGDGTINTETDKRSVASKNKNIDDARVAANDISANKLQLAGVNNKTLLTTAAASNTAKQANNVNGSKTSTGSDHSIARADKMTPAANSSIKTSNTGNANANKNTTGNTGTVAINNTHAVNEKAGNVNKANTDKIALSSHTSVANNTVTAGMDKISSNELAKGNKNVAIDGTKTNKPANTENVVGGRSVPVFVTKSGKKISGDQLQKLNMDRAKQNNNEVSATSLNALKGKRVIQKMALVEHFIKTTPGGEGFYKLDTVSVVTLTEELGIVTETSVPAKSKK